VKKLIATLFGMSLLLAPTVVSAQATAGTTDECSKELLLSYFPEVFVTQTLKKFNVPQDKWQPITQGLAAKDKDVLKIVEDKASKLNPNPFKDRDPAQRQVAVKIFRETLTQVFGDVVKSNGISDDKQVAAMLDDIQQQKAKNFALCMEKQKQSIFHQQQQPQQEQPSDSTSKDLTDADDTNQPADHSDSDKSDSDDQSQTHDDASKTDDSEDK